MTETVKLALTIAIAVGIMLFIGWVGDLQKRAAVGEQRGTKIETTAGTVADGVQADARRAERDTGTTQAATVFERTIVEVEREPTARDRADTPVPDRVRDAFRERRLARERSARLQGADAQGAGAEDAP